MTYYLLHAGQPSAQRLLKRVPRLHVYRSSTAVGSSDVVIRWGETTESDSSHGKILNPYDSVLRTKNRMAMGKFLRRVGIRFMLTEKKDAENNQRIIRQYRIPYFDLSALACFRSDRGAAWINQRIQRLQESFREVPFDDDKVTTRAIQLGMRTLHSLGLDHGLVSIGMGPHGILHVLDVTTNPILQGRLLDLYKQALEDYIDQDERLAKSGVGPFLLGSDMELMLCNSTGKLVLASKYLSRKGKVGCDDRSIQFDGQRLPLMELRPDPDDTPIGLLANLRSTMMEAATKINNTHIQWRAGSMPFRPYCTGGHLHFSNVPFSSHFIRVLDNYLGVPLMMVEDPLTARLRRPRYGFLGDVRHKNYGGFEYRTPGSFLVSPDVTAAAYCLAYVLAVHHRELPVFDIYEENMQSAFYLNRTDVMRPVVERNLTYLRRLAGYDRYKEYIDPLFEMIQDGLTWDEQVDVKAVWAIRSATRVRTIRARKAERRTMVRV
jgi:hypothetical protein